MSEAPPAPAPSAGALLRAAREAAGMHIGALAVGLKVPVRKIEALEADRLDLLPDAVFARALASSIARTLKADAGPILAALPPGQKPVLEMEPSAARMPMAGEQHAVRSLMVGLLRKPAVLVGMVLVAAALALVLIPAADAPSPSMNGAAAPVESTPAAATALAPVPDKGALTLQTVVSAGSGAAETSSATAGVGVGAEIQSSSGAASVVQLVVSGVTWVEVIDATGTVQLRKTLAAGDSASAGGPVPLKVVVGRMDATTLQVRGKPFDMAPFGKDNVARFEVR